MSNREASSIKRGSYVKTTPKLSLTQPQTPTHAVMLDIHANRQGVHPTQIANELNITPYHVKRALSGNFTAPKLRPKPTRPYGPLTLDEKIFIRDYCQELRIVDLKVKYSTSDTNISRALRGEFKS